MDRLKSQIEGQIQEIVFFGSLIISFSFFLSGVLYITLAPETLVFILGQFGGALDHALFNVFGFGFFYLSVIALHMGYVTNFHVFNFSDFKREYPVLLYSLFAHVLILSLFSTLLTVFQVYLQIPSSATLSHGAGGLIGSIFGAHLYSALGMYGSLLLLVVFKVATAIAAGFFEVQDVLVAVKTTSHTTARLSVKGAKSLNTTLLNGAQFFLKGNEFSEATAMGTQNASRFISRSINKANNLFTEHFHIYRDESSTPAAKAVIQEQKIVVKDAIKPTSKKVKMTSAMGLRSEKLMNSLKDLKKMTVISKSAKPKAKLAKKSATPEVLKTSKVIEKASKKKTSTVKTKSK